MLKGMDVFFARTLQFDKYKMKDSINPSQDT